QGPWIRQALASIMFLTRADCTASHPVLHDERGLLFTKSSGHTMPDQNDDSGLDLRESKLELRDEALSVREKLVELREKAVQRERWRDPLLLAIGAAFIGLAGNVIVTVVQGNQNLTLQKER